MACCQFRTCYGTFVSHPIYRHARTRPSSNRCLAVQKLAEAQGRVGKVGRASHDSARRRVSFRHEASVSRPDLNLLVALDVLLQEGNVARAARRLKLSPSAMSRALTRLRETTGDPLLVRAGRKLVATPRAGELRDRVNQLVADAEGVLRPVKAPQLDSLVRTFTLRTSDGFVENFGADLVARVAAEAPLVRLRFIQKVDKESAALREGAVDLETGVIEHDTGPELRTRALFRDRLVGAARRGHPLSKSRVTLARYAAEGHVAVTRRDGARGIVEDALAPTGAGRRIAASVGGFSAALALARASDLVATVPERHTASLRAGMFSFELPFPAPEFTVSMLWHPRLDGDAAHRWLRECVRDVCARPTG